MKRRGKNAFTLIELLVVIAIISVLVAMLMPVINTVRANARSLKCMSNLRTIGGGFSMYRMDYRNWLPPLNSFVSINAQGTSKPYGIYNAIGPYVGMPQWGGIHDPPTGNDDPHYLKFDSYWGSYKNAKFMKTVFYCPDSNYSPYSAKPPQPWYGVSYGESYYLQPPNGQPYSGGGNPKAYSFPRQAGIIPNPSGRIHVADATGSELGRIDLVGSSSFDLDRHMGGTNILFVDGHVAHYKANAVMTDITRDPSGSTTTWPNFCLP